jgi:hypothetical protein
LNPFERVVVISEDLGHIFNCLDTILVVLIGGEGLEAHALPGLERLVIYLLLHIGQLEVEVIYLLIDMDGLLLHLLPQRHIWLVKGILEHHCFIALG